MKIEDNSTPVVVLNCKLAALAIMRSLGPWGVPLFGVDSDPRSPGMISRYCRGKFYFDFDEKHPDQYLEALIGVGKEIGHRAILIPTSDETAIFVSENEEQLNPYFTFPQNPPSLVRRLASKEDMPGIAADNGVSTPDIKFPKNLDDVKAYANDGVFPVMLKGIFGNKLVARNQPKMVIVSDRTELINCYKRMEDPDIPNLMLQEYIPGGDDQIFIFNGYFDKNSDCSGAFTGHKIRQFPTRRGCASLGECRWNGVVAKITTDFMKNIHYQGILDIGYRFDSRDGKYKVLDINPRVGQAFRLFVAENDMDVVKALYLDLSGQESFPVVPREGRRWLIEDFDIVSCYHYYREGQLGVVEWIRSLRRVEETAWFNWRDPVPFLRMAADFLKKTLIWILKKVGLSTG